MTTSHPARTALVIRANGQGCAERIDIVPNTGLASLQEAVGGFIEAIHLGRDAVMYINEEGLLHGLPRNGVATEMYHQFYPAILRQEIVGDVIIVGVDPETGEERDHPYLLEEAATFLAAGHPYYQEDRSRVTEEEVEGGRGWYDHDDGSCEKWYD